MIHSGLTLENKWYLIENEYDLTTEPVIGTLFTTGNGYIGVRGSLEEFGSLRIQGAYIRGLIDEIYEIPQPFADNMYMKKYYFDEDKLKHFEKQDSIINFVDLLLVRVKIAGETFFPWEGELLSWKRTLDTKNSRLIREVKWQNSKGHITDLRFERFSSFADDHLYCIKVSITPENHSETIEVISGLDLRTKTNGQKVTKRLGAEIVGNQLLYSNLCGETYKFKYCTGVSSDLFVGDRKITGGWSEIDDGDLLASSNSFASQCGETYILEKKIFCITSRDTDDELVHLAKKELEELGQTSYAELYKAHVFKWNDFFDALDISIKGDENADISLRFSNYHTAISMPRNDSVHSLSAKGLTGETYNNFVWWDCEVYQAPIFYQTHPEAAKNTILYRYNNLESARQIAKEEGLVGARFPFTSSVTGLETVWEYARHPFLQIHIVSDVGLSIINYHTCTGDVQFLLKYGLEILWEVARYWTVKVELNEDLDRYEIKNVTGTDEHHPYVDNNAYTNYSVHILLKYAAKFYKEFKDQCGALLAEIGLSADEALAWESIAAKIYLPINDDTGLIPQFDNYFDLKRTLEVKGGSTAKSFQMKQSGLYNESQVIKQPDVMLMFSYMNIEFDDEVYRRNWNYYEARCEASSSLSYPVHSICASDMGQPESAYKYFLQSARLDMDDEHNCAWQGLHSACAAGAWLAVVRGIAGIIPRSDKIKVNPHMIPWWDEVTFEIVWHGQKLSITLTNKVMTIDSAAQNTAVVPIDFRGKSTVLEIGGSLSFDVALKAKDGIVFP